MSGQRKVRVAVDAMSGDGGARTALSGAALALATDPDLDLVLVGDAGPLERWRGALDESDRRRTAIVESESVLPMDVATARALRRGGGSSMHTAIDQVVTQQADSVVSAGNTGALMALSRQQLGMLPGIERPALMAALPASEEPVWVLDLGANVGVDAHRLREFAFLGHTAVRVLTGRDPRIGLLNIGHEPTKGPDVVREAARLIEQEAVLDYTGFVEANEVFSGRVDLVVCDGFAGNVLLKGAEGAAGLVFGQLNHEAGRGPLGWLLRRRLKRLHDRLDPTRHNGAPLLGLHGIVIKSHGGACERGFASAIALAALESRRNLIPALEHALWSSY